MRVEIVRKCGVTQTVWQWVAHEPAWDGKRCSRCGFMEEGRTTIPAIHDAEWGLARGEFVGLDR